MDAPPAFAITDPAWLAHRYDRSADAIRFRYVPRAQHAAAAFLTDEYLGPDSAPQAVSRAAAVAAAPTGRQHLLFHSAFCNSTLLVRALDRPGIAMGLSEPVILNDIVGMRRRGELDTRSVAERMDGAMRLLARPWALGETVIVKPSNILNPLASGMLTLRPDAQALLLHAPLETFIASVARKGMWCRLWVRELLEGLLRDGAMGGLGFDDKDWLRLTDLQVAAVCWVAQHQLFHALVARFGAARVRTLDSEVMMANPATALERLGGHFALPLDAAVARDIAASPVFTRHSKHGTAFSMADRRAEQAAANAVHGDEISKVAEWARVVAERAGIAETLPFSLLD
jgi:hypothetical protein